MRLTPQAIVSGVSPSETPLGWGGETGPERDSQLPEVTQQAWFPGSYLFASFCLQSLPLTTLRGGKRRERGGPCCL